MLTNHSLTICFLLATIFVSSPALAQKWRAMPLQTAEFRATGVPGGEGCQRIQYLTIDPVDGDIALMATDVGGIFRSTDSGKTWLPANTGLVAKGAAGIAFNPHDPERVLLAGDNTGNEMYPYNGVWLSTDGGVTWRQTLASVRNGTSRDETEPLAWDPSSFNPDQGYCTVAYWLDALNPTDPGGRLWKTEDAGETWRDVAPGKAYGHKGKWRLLRVTGDGAVLVGNDNGLWRSIDGGASFTRVIDQPIVSLDTVPSLSQTVWATTAKQLMRSDDGGATFKDIGTTPPGGFYRLTVSPADPQRMYTVSTKRNARKCFVSHDGGETWTQSKQDLSDSWVPGSIRYSGKAIQLAWHPTDPDYAIALYGDMVTRTEDGGKQFVWSNAGVNNIMIGGHFNFSAENPDLVYFGSQDYNGGLTKDGGKTWEFINLTISNTKDAVREGGDDSDPWGWVYGGYSPDGIIIFGGNKEYQGKVHDLWISFDGGKTSERKVRDLKGLQVSYSDPRDPNVLFAWSMRSDDRGKTWKKMDGCDGVFIASTTPDRTLYGGKGNKVVRSIDHGKTWQPVVELPKRVRYVQDVAYDHVNDRIWVAGKDNHLYRCDGPDYEPVSVRDRLPRDLVGDGFMASAVAIDPVDPRVVYAGACGTGLFIQRDNAVARSLDGGETWQRLTGDDRFASTPGVTPAQMTSAIRVHPVTRELWAMSCCYGNWVFDAPDPDDIGKPVESTPNRRKFPAPPVVRRGNWLDDQGNEITLIRNIDKIDYVYGPIWKKGKNVKTDKVDGRKSLVIDTTEHGGGGLILGGVDIAPDGQTHLAIELKPLPGNQADILSINLIGDGGKGGVSLDLESLPQNGFTIVTVPLPDNGPKSVKQIQFQGGNFSNTAKPLSVAITRVGSVTINQ